jgi:hypothetical protein
MAKELLFRAGASSSARATCFSYAMIAGFLPHSNSRDDNRSGVDHLIHV